SRSHRHRRGAARPPWGVPPPASSRPGFGARTGSPSPVLSRPRGGRRATPPRPSAGRGVGWAAVPRPPGRTARRSLPEPGTGAWGDGLDLGVRARAGEISQPSLAADTDDTFVLVQVARPTAEPGSPFHALAFRYDSRGASIWREAVDLGELSRPG